jgi:hypothetical protein
MMEATHGSYYALVLDGLLPIRKGVYRVSCTEREPSLVALSGHSTRHAASRERRRRMENEPWPTDKTLLKIILTSCHVMVSTES